MTMDAANTVKDKIQRYEGGDNEGVSVFR